MEWSLARSGAPLACLGALGLLLQGGDEPWKLAEPAPAIALRPESLQGLESYSCATCHEEVAREWARSAHGVAWLDEQYRAALKEKKRPALCYGCHVPEPLLAEGPGLAPRADAREEGRELGISCESCHLGPDGAQLGPRGTSVDAHPSQVSEHMSAPGSTALCSLCHSTNIGPVIGVAKDFAAADMGSRGLSCVGCHMAPVERSWAAGAPARTGRSHALQTPRDPAFLRLAFGLEWQAAGSRLVLANQAGHRVPGLIGREIRFTVELLDEGGNVLETAETVIDEQVYLPVQGTREVAFTKSGASVHVVGLHKDPRAPEPVTFLDERLEAR